MQAASVFASLAAARSTGEGYEVQDGYNFDVRYDAADETVVFDVIIPDGTWFGLLLGDDRMSRGTDIIMFKADGDSSEFYDATSKGYTSPQIDQADNLSGKFRKIGNEVKFTVSRPLETDDFNNDYVIPLDRDFKVGYAINRNSVMIVSI